MVLGGHHGSAADRDLAITTPNGNETVTTPEAAIAGTTGSVTPAVSVQYRIENSSGIGQFVTANGTLAWSGTASNLAPGLNTIRVRSYASDDSVIAEETVVINYYVPSPLTVAVSGSGSVTTGFSGTSTRAVGISYSIKASPASGWLFADGPAASRPAPRKSRSPCRRVSRSRRNSSRILTLRRTEFTTGC